MTHDPLCPTQNTDDIPGSCLCDLISRVYAAALRDAVEAVKERVQDLATCNKDDDCHRLARGADLALSDIEALGGER